MTRALPVLLALTFLAASAVAQGGPNAFTFVAFGDAPYREADVAKLDWLIAAINRLKPAFTIQSGFIDTVQAIARGARVFGKPVLIVHGDNHMLELESFKDTRLKPVANTFRLQLPGDELVHAMRVLVDPDMPGVFGFLPLIVPENGAF
jgi:hypothetical protein